MRSTEYVVMLHFLLSVTLMYCIKMAEDVKKLVYDLCWPRVT